MAVELATAALLAWRPGDPADAPLLRAGFALVVLLWASTLLVQSPAHGRLALAFDETTHGWLVASNWVRTLGWSLRGGLVAMLLVRALR